jgi:hypothetical protein
MPPDLTPIKAFFTEHLVLKLLALILATMAVYAIQSITSRIEEFEIPIVVNLDKGVAILKQDAKTAYITCRGSHDDLRRLDMNELKIVIEPKNTGIAGGERIPIGPHNVKGWTRGVKIEKVRPNVVAINFDLSITKQVGVAMPETVGKPLLGNAEVTYEPKLVTIKGPQSKLIDQKILRTEPIDVEGAVGSFNIKAKILTEGQEGVWHIEPSEVTAHINIVTEAISKEWKNIKVLALVNNECGSDLSFSPEFVDVSLHGSPQAINSISENNISVFVDCVGITTYGSFKIPAAIHLPPGINLSAAIEPPILTVISRKQQTEHSIKMPVTETPKTNSVTINTNSE